MEALLIAAAAFVAILTVGLVVILPRLFNLISDFDDTDLCTTEDETS